MPTIQRRQTAARRTLFVGGLTSIVLLTIGWALGHELGRDSAEDPFRYPRIQGHGKIVPLPQAAQPPRDGSRILVDITAGGEPDELHPTLEKLARYVNIYAGSGDRPATARIVAVLHGKATTLALSDPVYRRHYQVGENPNAALIATLADSGVEFLVCGQSLTHNGFQGSDVRSQCSVAVSALTACVNLQSDGFAYIPLP